MKKYQTIIIFVLLLTLISWEIYFSLIANKKSGLSKSEKSEAAILLEKINRIDKLELDQIFKKIELLKKYGNIPVSEGQGGRVNPFVPF